MEKVKKLKLFYNLSNAQGIQASVNTRTFTSTITHLVTTSLTPAYTPISATKTSTYAPEVDQVIHVAV